MDEVLVEVKPGTYPNLDDIVVEDEPTLLLPCVICNKTFKPEVLQRHSKVCEKNVCKKRKTFDSFKQRVKGTDLAEFLPFSTLQRRASGGEKPPSPLRNTQWKEKHEAFVTAIRAARGDLPSERGGSGEPRSILRPPDHEQCPYCERHFGPKAFDRHQEWCREQHSRQPPATASIQAKERLEARIKYRAPPIKSKRALTREKYSPLVQRKVRQTSPASIANSNGSTCTSAGSSSSRQAVSTFAMQRQEQPQKLIKSGNSLLGRTQSKDSSALGLNRGAILRTSLRSSQRQTSTSPVKRFSGSIKGSSSPQSHSTSVGSNNDNENKADVLLTSVSGKKFPLKNQSSKWIKPTKDQKSTSQSQITNPIQKDKNEQQKQTLNNDNRKNWNNKTPKAEQVWRGTCSTSPIPPYLVSVPSDFSSDVSPRHHFKSSNKQLHQKVNSVMVNEEVTEMTVSQCHSKKLSVNQKAFNESQFNKMKSCQSHDETNFDDENDLEEVASSSLDSSSIQSLVCSSSHETCASSLHSADSNRTYVTSISVCCDGESIECLNQKYKFGVEAPNLNHESDSSFHDHTLGQSFQNTLNVSLKPNFKSHSFPSKLLRLKFSNPLRKRRKVHCCCTNCRTKSSGHLEKCLHLFNRCLSTQTSFPTSLYQTREYAQPLIDNSIPSAGQHSTVADPVATSQVVSHGLDHEVLIKKSQKNPVFLTTWADVKKSGDNLWSKYFTLNFSINQKSNKEPPRFALSGMCNDSILNACDNQMHSKSPNVPVKQDSEKGHGFKNSKVSRISASKQISLSYINSLVLEDFQNLKPEPLKYDPRSSVQCTGRKTPVGLLTSQRQQVLFPEIPHLKTSLGEKKMMHFLSGWKSHRLCTPQQLLPTVPHVKINRNFTCVRLPPLSPQSKFSGGQEEEPYDPYASAERQMLELLHSDSASDINISLGLKSGCAKQCSPAASLPSPTVSPKPTRLETSPTSAFTRYSKESESPQTISHIEDQTKISAPSNDSAQVDSLIQMTVSPELPRSCTKPDVSMESLSEGKPQPPPRSFKRSASLQTCINPPDHFVSEKSSDQLKLKSFHSVEVVLESNNNSDDGDFHDRPRTYDVETGTHVRKVNSGKNGCISTEDEKHSGAAVDAPFVLENANGGKIEVLQLDPSDKKRNETRESREIREITSQDSNMSGIDGLLEEVVRMQQSVSMLSELDSTNNKRTSGSPYPQSLSSARSRRNRTGKMHIEDFLFPAEMLEQANENLRSSFDSNDGSSSVFGSTKSRSKSRRLLEQMLFPITDLDINANTDISHEDEDVVVSPNACYTFPVVFDSNPEKSDAPPHCISPVALTSKVFDDDDDGLPRPKPLSLSTHSSGAHAGVEQRDKEPLSVPTSPTQPPTRSRQSTGSRLSADSAYSSLNRRSPVLQGRRQIPGVPTQELQQRRAHGNESPQSVLSHSFAQSLALSSSSGSESSLPPVTSLPATKRGARNKQDRDTPSSDIISATTPLFPKLSKFCHECGTKFSVSLAKFCCECGARRLELS